MYCCHAFENLINSAGDSGFAILVTRLNGELRFVLQMRAMSYSDAETCDEVKTLPEDKKVALTQSMIIRYCPSCGKQLSGIASAHSEELEKFVLGHGPFQDDWGV